MQVFRLIIFSNRNQTMLAEPIEKLDHIISKLLTLSKYFTWSLIATSCLIVTF